MKLAGLIRVNLDRKIEQEFKGYPTAWAALAADPAYLGSLSTDPRWRPLRVRDGVRLWTDDYSNIFSVFIWSVPRMERMKAGGKAR
jgi:hypothetical protein